MACLLLLFLWLPLFFASATEILIEPHLTTSGVAIKHDEIGEIISRQLHHLDSNLCRGTMEENSSGSIYMEVVGRPGLITNEEIEVLEDALITVYDGVSFQTCRVGYRRLSSSRINRSSIPQSVGVQKFTIEFEVIGLCKGCARDPRFFAAARGSRAQSRNLFRTENTRRLPTSNEGLWIQYPESQYTSTTRGKGGTGGKGGKGGEGGKGSKKSKKGKGHKGSSSLKGKGKGKGGSEKGGRPVLPSECVCLPPTSIVFTAAFRRYEQKLFETGQLYRHIDVIKVHDMVFPPTPTRSPAAQPTMCSTLISGVECCTDLDCNALQVCTSSICLDEGNPRITLIWDCDLELDLFVISPSGVTIFWGNPTDTISGGSLEQSPNQGMPGSHVDSVSFPLIGGPEGAYTYYVREKLPGGAACDWETVVYVDGEAVQAQMWTGNSGLFSFDFISDVAPTDPPEETGMPTQRLTSAPSSIVVTEAPTVSTTTVSPTVGPDETSIPTQTSQTPTAAFVTEAPTLSTTAPTAAPEETSLPTSMPDTSTPTSMLDTAAPTSMADTVAPTSMPDTPTPTIMTDTAVPTSIPDTANPTSMIDTTAPTTNPSSEPSPKPSPGSAKPSSEPSNFPIEVPTQTDRWLSPNCGKSTNGFQICLEMLGTFRNDEENYFTDVVAFWENLVDKGVNGYTLSAFHLANFKDASCAGGDYNFPSTFDGVYICGRFEDIDGPGNILGRGGVYYDSAEGTATPTELGNLIVDESDRDRLSVTTYRDMLRHEIGHVLGIGSSWKFGGLTDLGDNTYTGEKGKFYYNELSKCIGLPPIDAFHGHWDEKCFVHELMSVSLLTGTDAITSKVTLGVLEDLGYEVDYNKADFMDENDFSLPDCNCISERTTERKYRTNLRWSQQRGRR